VCASDPDPGLCMQMMQRSNQAFAAPIEYVGGNIDEVLSIVQSYGDVNGYPPTKVADNPWLGPLALAGVAVLFLMISRSE
jgi:hypothetical protein